jgi:hypothetical protein
MVKAVTALSSTLLFGLFGLLIGWLSVKAQIETQIPGTRISPDLLLVSYGVAPLVGALLGFVLAVMAMKLFASSETQK